jgi:hypothetical protein
MSKNQKTVLLLITVVIIWTAVGWQVFNLYTPSEPIAIQTIEKFEPTYSKKQTDYTIVVDYRDPFLGKLYKKPKPKAKKKKVKPPVVFPVIAYNGMINGQSKTFIITIEGTQQLFKIGGVISGVELVKGDADKVILKYQNETKTYLRVE